MESTTTHKTNTATTAAAFGSVKVSRPVPRLRRTPHDDASHKKRRQVVRLIDNPGQKASARLRIAQREHVAEVAERLRRSGARKNTHVIKTIINVMPTRTGAGRPP